MCGIAKTSTFALLFAKFQHQTETAEALHTHTKAATIVGVYFSIFHPSAVALVAVEAAVAAAPRYTFIFTNYINFLRRQTNDLDRRHKIVYSH